MTEKVSPLFKLLSEEYRHLGFGMVLCFIIGILIGLAGIDIGWCVMGAVVGVVTVFYLFGRKRFYISLYLFWFVAFLSFGYGCALYRMHHVAAPVLAHPMYDVRLSGVVTESAFLTGKQTIVIDDVRLLNEASVMPPARIKLRYASEEPVLAVGSRITADVFLRPPGKPVAPGAYDESRHLWFSKIGAVGKIDKVLSVAPSADVSVLKQKLESIREVISRRVRAVLPDEEARITIPLIIGEQGVVTQRLYDLFRNAGITHVLSVSGFHLSLLAAFVFLVIRGLLSLFPVLTERVSAKKIAAVVALLFSAAYIGISGMQIPAIRSFIMIAIVLVAVLFDRNALSVRSVSIAAVVILAIRPEMILNIGFQLSFLAVLILVTLYHPLYRFIFVRKRRSVIGRVVAFVGGFMLVDILTSLATTPFIIYHFQTYALYSGLGNLLTGTLFSFWIMPLLLIAVLLMPIGLDAVFLKMAGWGLAYVIDVCERIGELPMALTTFPAYPTMALFSMLAGILLLCLMRTKLRLIGFVFMIIGIFVACIAPRPDVLVGDGGRSIAVREENGRLRFLSLGKSDFAARIGLTRNGEEERRIRVPKERPAAVWVKGKKIAFTDKACDGADICFVSDPGRHPRALPLYQWETRAVYIRPYGIRVYTAGGDTLDNPWYAW